MTSERSIENVVKEFNEAIAALPSLHQDLEDAERAESISINNATNARNTLNEAQKIVTKLHGELVKMSHRNTDLGVKR